jgi:TRAP-type transport system periplasmic protein
VYDEAVRGLAFALAFAATFVSSSAHAEDVVLRMAAIAPDGSSWARSVRALGRDVEAATNGGVRMRWYVGGIAGDEKTALARVRRGQLDGFAGASSCDQLSPTMKVARVMGLVQSRAEGLHLLQQLRPRIDDDLKQQGFVELALGGFGLDVLFLRAPVRTLADLRKVPLFVWNVDPVLHAQLTAMGMRLVADELEKLDDLFDAGQIDGVFAIPAAALAFQWTTRFKYFVDLKSSYLPGCLVVTQKAFNQVAAGDRDALRAASARFNKRFEDDGQRDDAQLVSSLLERQGMKRLKLPELRDELFAAARDSRHAIPPAVVAPELLAKATSILAQLRVTRAP